jgi:signal transduction histidine kinase
LSKAAIATLTAGALLLFAGLRTVDLAGQRRDALQLAERRAANLSFILADYLREMFTAADASLRQLALNSARIGGPAGAAAQWTPTLSSALAGLSGVGSVTVTDAAGIIRHSTQPLIVGQSRAAEYVFQRLATTSRDELVVGEPYLSVREPRTYLIPIARRLTAADGTFAGTITATVIPSTQRPFFRTVDVGRAGFVWVFHPNGFVLFREPSPGNPTGAPAEHNAVFDAAKRTGAAGIVNGPAERGGAALVTGYTRSADPPLIAAVSLGRDEVLAPWRRQAYLSAWFFGVLAAMTGAALAGLFRQMDAKARAEDQLADARRREAVRLRELNDQLAAALAREREAGTLKDEFLMMVSHELRTPLTAIHGWARMLVSGEVDPARREAGLRVIERNARAQTQLIDDLLDVSRAIAGRLRLDVRAVDLAALVDDAVETVRSAVDAKGQHVETAIAADLGAVAADPDRLQQIVWNLVSNAVKFTPAGGRITIGARRDGDTVEIAVADTGAGIAPEFLPHVFERFRQQESGTTRRHGGLGLGLAIVRLLVELHGGSVHAESDGPGRGATFRVRLPAKPVH